MLFRARAEQGRLRLWFQVIGDLLFHAPREHWSMLKQGVPYACRSWYRTPAIPAIAVRNHSFRSSRLRFTWAAGSRRTKRAWVATALRSSVTGSGARGSVRIRAFSNVSSC